MPRFNDVLKRLEISLKVIDKWEEENYSTELKNAYTGKKILIPNLPEHMRGLKVKMYLSEVYHFPLINDFWERKMNDPIVKLYMNRAIKKRGIGQ